MIIKNTITIFFVILVNGCTIYGPNDQFGTYYPAPNNGYTGKVAFEPLADLNEYMHGRCATYGGLDLSSIRNADSNLILNNLGFVKAYRCNGPVATPSRQEVIRNQEQQEIERLRRDANAARIKQQELEEQLKQVKQQSLAPIPSSVNLNKDRKSLEVSKVKCSELGFKSGTEAFGKCVLQLSK